MTTTATFETRFRSVDGVRIRYAEGGRPDGPTVLLTSPWPESVYAFASIWDSLADRGRLFAADTVASGIPDEIRDDYRECYDGERFVQSMLFARRYPEQLPELAELLPSIETPVTILCGRHDRVVPLANAEFLDARLPSSNLQVIDAGHFVWEEEPAQYGSAVLESILEKGVE
jgi:pimeloyl-ACP methyl ester carboxylesterase